MAANLLAGDLDHVLTQVGGDWDALKGARLFITGGTGFFGCWLLETLLWANDARDLKASVTVLTRDADGFQRKAPHLAAHPAVTLWPGDVRTFAYPAGAFSHVIHAGTSSSTPVEPQELFETIVEGTRRTLTFARQAGVRRFLFTSSGAVYGAQPPDITHVSEDYAGGPNPADPGSAYAEGKRAAEMLCALHADAQMATTIARCFAFVGPYLPLDAHFAAGNFIRDALAGGPIRVNGDGSPYRSYLYAPDLAIWLWTILLRGESGRPYNVGSEEAVTVLGLATVVAGALQGDASIVVRDAALPGAVARRYVPDTKRARKELHLGQAVALPEALQRTAAWQRTRDTDSGEMAERVNE